MPFGSNNEYSKGNIESDFIYNYIICKGIDRFGLATSNKINIIREVDKNTSGCITKSILNNIATADICIADITGKNPNVFFELGIRYSLRHKVTILLKQKGTIIPFDISGYKCITYDCFSPNQAISAISDFLISGIEEHNAVDSLVFETFPEMQVFIPGVLKSARETNIGNILSWNEWWSKVLELASLLRDAHDNGRFVPKAILGISNGGLMVADLLGREVFKGTPILALWANRWISDKSSVDPSYYYFDNDYNKAISQTLRDKYIDHSDKITILLIDDLVFTSNTIVQASNFIEKELGGKAKILFAPLYCRDTDYLESIKDMLPNGFRNGETFKITKELYYSRLRTKRANFPYRKVLGSE